MRPSSIFLTWLLLVSTAASLSTPERWRFERDGLMNKRQDPVVPTDPSAVTTDPATTSPSAPISTDAQPTSEPATISDPATTSAPPDTSQIPTSSPAPTSNPPQTGPSSSSIGLLFTQTTATSHSIVAATTIPATDNGDSTVTFFDSKYHQLIIALGSVSAALLIGLIVTAIIAFRARADNDLLHDRLSRYEEGIDLPPRGSKAGSSASLGGYGRLSLHDPEDMRQSRRSLSEGQLRPMAGARRVSGTPMGSGTPGGGRRVTFSGSDGMHSATASGSSDHTPLLPPASNKSDAPLFPEAQYPTNQARSASTSIPPPAIQGVALTDNGAVRKLPAAPKGLNIGHGSYTDPFAGGPSYN